MRPGQEPTHLVSGLKVGGAVGICVWLTPTLSHASGAPRPFWGLAAPPLWEAGPHLCKGPPSWRLLASLPCTRGPRRVGSSCQPVLPKGLPFH